MDVYYELLKKPVFTLNDVNQFYHNMESACSAVRRLLNKGRIVRIKKNMYTCISGETDSPVANKYQIGCAITESSYISHHTAMEYYVMGDQVYYDIYVSSKTPFKEFEFDGYNYCYIASKCDIGIEEIMYSGGIRVTTKERTVVDSIKDMDKIAGIEEVIADIEAVTYLQEKRLLQYLQAYHNQFLYQKTGYLLLAYQNKLGLSDDFFEFCRGKIGKSKRYLTKEMTGGKYDNSWKLVVPNDIYGMKNGVLDDSI